MIMRIAGKLFFALLLSLLLTNGLAGQEADSERPLTLTGSVPLPDVQGRIDHFGFDPKGRLFISALGNNAEEVVDLVAQRRIHVIAGIPSPQGVVYSPETNRIFVGSEKGKFSIYDGTTFALVASIDFHGDVDNLRYDAPNKRVYVGYGDDEAAAIGIVDATTNKRLREEFKLGAHPESFQLEALGARIFVNLPDLKQIAVVNRETGAIAKWPVSLEKNFPMALDESDHRLFVVTRYPPRLLAFDTESGHTVAALPVVQDADDVYYDAERKRIYVPGGEGYISVFQQRDADHYELLAKIPTAVGARTAGYFGKLGKKGFDRFYLAVPASASRPAEVQIYTVQE
jgi:hypothetical protein